MSVCFLYAVVVLLRTIFVIESD